MSTICSCNKSGALFCNFREGCPFNNGPFVHTVTYEKDINKCAELSAKIEQLNDRLTMAVKAYEQLQMENTLQNDTVKERQAVIYQAQKRQMEFTEWAAGLYDFQGAGMWLDDDGYYHTTAKIYERWRAHYGPSK
jgi:hypothetical protein